MNVRLTLAALFFGLLVAGCIAANIIYFAMIRAINQRRPSDKQLSIFGLKARARFFDDLNEYRTLYPRGRLRTGLQTAYAAMFVGFAATIACLMLQ